MSKNSVMLKPLTNDAIGNDYACDLSVQDYGKKTPIEGVQIINLNLFVDDGGALAEIVRFDDDGNLQVIPQFKARQATFSQVLPGAIKAFHLHYNQEDVWFILPGDRVLIGLFDARKDSPTYKKEHAFRYGSRARTNSLFAARRSPWAGQCLAKTSAHDLFCQSMFQPGSTG